MNASPVAPSLTQPSPVVDERSILFNLLRQEWRYWGGPVTVLAMIWVIGLWVLVIFSHPAWLLWLGLCYVLVSSVQAGRDVIDGTEEFSFAQPPGRGPLYLARMVPGLAFLAVNGLLGGLAIYYSLPQRLWSLVFSGGLTENFAPVANGYWYAMAVLLPLAAHAITFAMAANAGSRGMVNAALLTGIAAAVAVMLVGFYAEFLLWGETNGFLASPALFATATLVLLAGYFAYLRKEATGSAGAAGGSGGLAILWINIGMVVLILLALMFFRVSAVRSERSAADKEMEMHKAMEMRTRQTQAERVSPTPPAKTKP